MSVMGSTRAPHGTRSRYVVGCRCAECTAENTRYQAEWYRRPLAGLEHGSLWAFEQGCRCEPCYAAWQARPLKQDEHGTAARYSGTTKCRCRPCRDAWSAYCFELRLFRGDPPTHGPNGYKNYRCRCDVCRDSYNAYQRAAYQRRKAANGASRPRRTGS